MCVLTRRAAELAEARLYEAGKGRPPVPYAVLVLGSAGRGESLLAADQDNAIVYETGEPSASEDQWFEALGIEIAAILDAAGVPFCKGGVMARNAAVAHERRPLEEHHRELGPPPAAARTCSMSISSSTACRCMET